MSTAPPTPSDLLDVALDCASAAVWLVHVDRPDRLHVETKSTATDLVTEMDRSSEALIRELIARRRPDDVVVGEEAGDGGQGVSSQIDGGRIVDGAGVTWWVDPIDGTTNYVYDHPGYAVSIAAAIDGEVVAGVVADPTHGRTYAATLHGGARCWGSVAGRSEDRSLRLGAPAPLERMLVATGFAYDAEQRRVQGRVVAELLPRIRDIRRMGAAALDLCSLAAGRVDGYYEAGLAVWDYAAGALIATEAGARVGGLDGGAIRPGSVLAAHPERFEQLRDLLSRLDDVEPG